MDLPGWQNGGASKGAAVAEHPPHSPCRDPFPGEAASPLDEGLLPSGAAFARAPRALWSPRHTLGLSPMSAHQARDCVSDTHIRARRAETQEPALQPWLETQPSQRPELPWASCLQGPWEARGWVGTLGVRALAGGGTAGSSWGLPGPAQPHGALRPPGQQPCAHCFQQDRVPAGFTHTEQPPPGATEARRHGVHTASRKQRPHPRQGAGAHFLVLEAKGQEGVQERAGLETGQEGPPPRAQHGVCEAEAEPTRPRPPLSPGEQSPDAQAAGGCQLCEHWCPRAWLPWRKPGGRGQGRAGEGLPHTPRGF